MRPTILVAVPRISAAVLVDHDRIACDRIAGAVKKTLPHAHVIALSARLGFACAGADHHLNSHNPEQLVGLMRELLGDPRNVEPSR